MDESGPICIEFRGIKCMQSNVAKARVLYLEVHEESGHLQKMSDAIFEHILERGLYFIYYF